jgi:2-C-methyl-D-erythritol 4-phosphate cytidylyltransferase
MIYGTILAGGSGKRFGSLLPKQFIPMGERSVLLYSVSTFVRSGFFDKVIVSVPQEFIDHTNNLLKSENLSADVICGGAERFESLEKVCKHIRESYEVSAEDILISHDGVRPFVSRDIIKRNIDAVKRSGFSATALHTTDTILCDNKGDYSIPDRKNLYNLQTPQGFYIQDFFENYNNLSDADKSSLTDASAIFLKNGKKIELVEGSPYNFKITTTADLVFGEALLLTEIQKSVEF